MKSVDRVTIKSPLVYQQSGLVVQVSTRPHPASIDLLQETIYGTEGIRYIQTGQAERIQQLTDSLFFSLLNQQQLIGLYCLDKRSIGFPEHQLPGYYGRYLAVRADHQGKGFGKLLKTTAVDYVQRNVSAPYLFYSYIEENNTRSMTASRNEGFQSVAQLGTYMFRRFSPYSDRRVRPLLPNESAQAQQLVTNQYGSYGFQNFIHINQQQPYFVLEDAGQLVAGVQAIPIQWQLMHIPGWAGPFIQHIAPNLPGLRRFFNPACQSFLTLEGVCIDPDRAALLAPLLESVLAHYGHHTAMWQIDERDPLRSLLTSSKMGWLSGFQSGVTTHVMAKSVGLPTSITLGNNPVYVSSFDYS